MATAEIAATIATAAALAGLLPQTVRVRRTGDIAGLSLAWPALGVVTEAAWTVYAVHEQLWLLAPSAVAMVVFDAALFWVMARTAAPFASSLVPVGMWALALTLVALLAGAPALGVVLGSAYGVQIAPLLWAAYRTPAPTGLAPATWLIATGEFALWWVYGELTDDVGVKLLGLVGGASSVALLARWIVTRPPSLSSLTWRPRAGGLSRPLARERGWGPRAGARRAAWGTPAARARRAARWRDRARSWPTAVRATGARPPWSPTGRRSAPLARARWRA